MEHLRLWAALGIFGLLAGAAALPQARQPGDGDFGGGSYLTTIEDSTGYFTSRSVITLHADRTMSGTDSGQGGPAYFFTSQRGSWRLEGRRRVVAKMIDFLSPPGGPGIARVDYTIDFVNGYTQLTGTITLRVFPLDDGNPLHGEGDLIDTFSFVGELIKP